MAPTRRPCATPYRPIMTHLAHLFSPELLTTLLAGFTLYRRSQRALAADPADFVAQPQTSQSSVIVTSLDPRAEEIE